MLRNINKCFKNIKIKKYCDEYKKQFKTIKFMILNKI